MFNSRDDIKPFRKRASTEALREYCDPRKRDISIAFTKEFENESILSAPALALEDSFLSAQTKTTELSRSSQSPSLLRCDSHGQDAAHCLTTVNVEVDQDVEYSSGEIEELLSQFQSLRTQGPNSGYMETTARRRKALMKPHVISDTTNDSPSSNIVCNQVFETCSIY